MGNGYYYYSTYHTSSSYFYNLKTKVEADVATLKSKSTSYSTEITTATTSISKADFTGWDDSVSSKMQLAKTDLSSAISTISSDISASGNLGVLISKMESLASTLGSCGYYVDEINKIGTIKQDDPEYETKTNKQNKAFSNLGGYGTQMDSLIASIESIVFNGKVNTDDSAAFEPESLDDETTSQGTPAEETTSSEDTTTTTNRLQYLEDAENGAPMYETTYMAPDPYTGEMKEYEMLVNGETGAIVYGNREDGYYIVCISDNGTVYDGFIKGSEGCHASDFESLLTDNHENSESGWFEHSSSTYGYEYDIDPGTVGYGSYELITVDLGDGHVVTVASPTIAASGMPAYPTDYLNETYSIDANGARLQKGQYMTAHEIETARGESSTGYGEGEQFYVVNTTVPGSSSDSAIFNDEGAYVDYMNAANLYDSLLSLPEYYSTENGVTVNIDGEDVVLVKRESCDGASFNAVTDQSGFGTIANYEVTSNNNCIFYDAEGNEYNLSEIL